MAKILAIDDNRDNLIVLSALLADSFPDADFISSRSGAEGIKKCIAEKPDVVLLDILMPEMDGYEVCSILKSNEITRIIPIIMVTAARTDKESRIKALECGADAFLTKPLDESELRAQLKAMFRIKESEDRKLDEKERLKRLVAERTIALRTELEERKRTERALKESEYFFKESQQAAFVGSYKFDLAKNYWSSSEVLEAIFGIDGDDDHSLTGWLGLVHPEDREMMAQYFSEEVLSKRNPFNKEYRVIRKSDGESRWVLGLGKLNFDAEDKVVEMIGTIQDITERKKAEESLRDTNEFNSSLLKTIPFEMDIVDEQGNILFQSENFEHTFGRGAIGCKCWDLYRDDKTQCPGCPLFNGIEIGRIGIYESAGVLGGRVFEISHTGMMFHGKKAMLEIFQDITERKQMMLDLIRSKERAEESDRLKSAFLANMSHEIRTPLNSIIGFSELMTDPNFNATQQFEFAKMINVSGNNLLSIITDIMDISKIEAGQIRVENAVFSVGRLLSGLQREYSFNALKKGLQLKLDQLNTTEDILCESDENKVRQVLVNLIGNAIKFTKEGVIELGVRVTNEFVQFHVRDTGIGIPDQYHNYVFDRFRQVESADTRRYGGNGLGLAISKSLVELLGGKIWVESAHGKGSVFYFTIPKEVPEKTEHKEL